MPMAENERQPHQMTDDEWELYVAKMPPLLRPKDLRTIPSWMLYHYNSFPKRFDTHFFLAAMPERQEAAHDQLETTAGVWITPEEALAGSERGEFPIVFATIHQLRELTGLASVAAAQARFADTTPKTIMPRVVERDDASVIVLSEDEE